MRYLVAVLFVSLAFPASAVQAQGRSDDKTDVAPKPIENKGNSETEKLKGRRVMVIEEGAEIKTRELGVVWKAYIGEVLTVTLVNDNWLWIFERQGWLNAKQVVPHETAVYEINAMIKKSKRAENYGLRGIAHMNLGDYEAAIKDFNVVIRRNPNDPDAYLNRGNAYRFQGENKKAIDDYSKAINLDNKHFLAMNNRAMVQTTLKEYDLALADLNAAVALNENYPEAHNNRGILFSEQRKYKDAVTEFTQAISLYPRYADAYVNRAAASIKLEKYEDARRDFSQAVLLAPSDDETLNDFAWFLATCKDKEFRNGEKALEMAETALDLKPRSWNAMDTRGAAYAETGKFAQAERWVEKALQLAPEDEHRRLKSHLAAYKQRKPIRD